MINKFNKKKTRWLREINFILNIFFHTSKNNGEINFEEVKNILVIDPTMIGDIVMLTPFLRIIRKNIPGVKITLVCRKWAEQILRYQKLVDEYVFIEKETFSVPKIKKDSRKKFQEAISKINSREYDLAIEPRGDLRYIYFMHYCKAKRKISYSYTGGTCFLTDVVAPGKKTEHLVEDKVYLLKQLGMNFKRDDIYPRLFLTNEQKVENDRFLEEHNATKKLVIGIHPGASLEIKQWKGFADLVKKIQNSIENCMFLVFEGPNEEGAVKRVLNAGIEMNADMHHLKVDIVHYMQFLALCDWVICNDSGAGHIAAAYGVNVITIFGPVLPSLARPYKEEGVFIVSDDSIACKPCISSFCNKEHRCIDCISVEEVYELLMDKIKLRKEKIIC